MKDFNILLNVNDVETAIVFNNAIGKKIKNLEIVESEKNSFSGAVTELIFTFDDGTSIKLFDDGQTCCESRYIQTDDNLDYFKDATLWGCEIREITTHEIDDEDDNSHEIQYIVIETSKGCFTLETHNVHNGYYGGFYVVVREV